MEKQKLSFEQNFIASKGLSCPHCNCSKVRYVSSKLEFEINQATFNGVCDDCKGTWVSTYDVDSYDCEVSNISPKMNNERFLKEGGKVCPYCTSINVKRYDDPYIYLHNLHVTTQQDMGCNTCGKDWNINYILNKVT